MQIKSIDTQYKGYLFRSRLEARYAYLFDLAGVRWSYEPDAYQLDDGTNYLPDFFVSVRDDHWRREEFENPGYWVEIKGRVPTEHEIQKMHMLAVGTGHHGFIFFGDVDSNDYVKCDLDGKIWRPDMLGLSQCVIFSDCPERKPTSGELQRFISLAKQVRFDRGSPTV